MTEHPQLCAYVFPEILILCSSFEGVGSVRIAQW